MLSYKSFGGVSTLTCPQLPTNQGFGLQRDPEDTPCWPSPHPLDESFGLVTCHDSWVCICTSRLTGISCSRFVSIQHLKSHHSATPSESSADWLQVRATCRREHESVFTCPFELCGCHISKASQKLIMAASCSLCLSGANVATLHLFLLGMLERDLNHSNTHANTCATSYTAAVASWNIQKPVSRSVDVLDERAIRLSLSRVHLCTSCEDEIVQDCVSVEQKARRPLV